MSIAPRLADIRPAASQFPSSWAATFWISADHPGWTVWFSVRCDAYPSRGDTFATRGEAEAFVAGLNFAVMALTPRQKTRI